MSTPDPATDFAPLRLKKAEERRLRAGHPWVYSNEVDTDATPLRLFEPGQPVIIETHTGKSLGTGYINPHSLICARLVSRDAEHPFSPSLLVHRLNVALALRERIYRQPCYRLIYGEADGLPGLVVDRYGEYCVVQITTAGMERLRDAILAALHKVIRPRAVLWRNDSPVRELEGLSTYVETTGDEPLPETVLIEENGTHFEVPLASGQKTGWYYDHQDNRARLLKYVADRQVLDLFSYLGGWGIQAVRHGAASALCVDDSARALGYAAANATRNGLADRVTTRQGDAFSVLKTLREERARFDIVVLDPPAFIKRRKDLKEGLVAYRRLNEMAMQVLAREGLLVSCACSQLLTQDTLESILLQSARHLDRSLQLLERGQQGPDHPVHPAIPETAYLKALFVRVLPA